MSFEIFCVIIVQNNEKENVFLNSLIFCKSFDYQVVILEKFQSHHWTTESEND